MSMVSLPGPSLPLGPKSPSSSTPLGSSTHSLLGNLPCTCYRGIGLREVARPTVLSLGEQTPKSRRSKVNLGLSPLALRALTYQFPECRNSDVTRALHLDSTMPSGGPTRPRSLRDFAFRESATPSLLLLRTPNAGIPIFWIRATCPCSDRRS